MVKGNSSAEVPYVSDYRYCDLYFNEEEYNQAVLDLANSKVYDELLIHGHDIPVAGGSEENDVARVVGQRDSPPGVIQPGQVGQALPQPEPNDSVARRRYLMMGEF